MDSGAEAGIVAEPEQPVLQQSGSQAKRLRIRRCNKPSRQKSWQSLQVLLHAVVQLVLQVCSQQPVLHSEANQR
jgi:hypothetical protein